MALIGNAWEREMLSRQNYFSDLAQKEIFDTYGDTVEVKPKTLLKFGENPLIGTSEATIMTLPAGVLSETYVSTNAITHASSSSGSDTGTVTIEGHTIDGSGNLTFAVQTVTLTGQTKKALGTPLARVTRVANTSAANWVGNIYVFEDDTLSAGVPQTDAKVHMIAPQAENQSLKASTAFSQYDYGLITHMYASFNKKTAGFAVVRLKVRNKGGVFRTLFKRGVSNGSDIDKIVEPYLIIPKNSDVIMTAEADGASTPISGGFHALLALVQ